MRMYLFVSIVAFFVQGCAQKKVVDLKSPCAATSGPCVRRPVNNWWINNGSGMPVLS